MGLIPSTILTATHPISWFLCPAIQQPVQPSTYQQPVPSLNPRIPPASAPGQTIRPSIPSSVLISTPPSQSDLKCSAALSIQADEHAKSLHSLGMQDKAFQIKYAIRGPSGAEIHIGKATSEMIVISRSLMDHLQLSPQPLANIGFEVLTMHTTDHRDTAQGVDRVLNWGSWHLAVYAMLFHGFLGKRPHFNTRF